MHWDDDVRRQHRRLLLETRTLTISLRSALDDLDLDPALTIHERARLRRDWCDRVRLLLQDVRARSMQLDALTTSNLAVGSELAWEHQTLDEAEAAVERLGDEVRRVPKRPRATLEDVS